MAESTAECLLLGHVCSPSPHLLCPLAWLEHVSSPDALLQSFSKLRCPALQFLMATRPSLLLLSPLGDLASSYSDSVPIILSCCSLFCFPVQGFFLLSQHTWPHAIPSYLIASLKLPVRHLSITQPALVTDPPWTASSNIS